MHAKRNPKTQPQQRIWVAVPGVPLYTGTTFYPSRVQVKAQVTLFWTAGRFGLQQLIHSEVHFQNKHRQEKMVKNNYSIKANNNT